MFPGAKPKPADKVQPERHCGLHRGERWKAVWQSGHDKKKKMCVCSTRPSHVQEFLCKIRILLQNCVQRGRKQKQPKPPPRGHECPPSFCHQCPSRSSPPSSQSGLWKFVLEQASPLLQGLPVSLRIKAELPPWPHPLGPSWPLHHHFKNAHSLPPVKGH